MTQFFDWLDFTGGYLDGRRVRCQLVSVPGQAAFLRRRRHLLATADAVVFVADAHPLLVEENRGAVRALMQLLREQEGSEPIGLVLQANKQDRPTALAPEELARRLELPAHVPVFGARADACLGVREVFMFAVRLAAERVRALTLRNGLVAAPEGWSSADALYADLRTLELDGTGSDAEAAGPATTHGSLSSVASPGGGRETTPADLTGSQVVSTMGPRVEASGRASWPTLPDPASVPAGCNWPPVVARSMLAALRTGEARWSASARRWAPMGCIEVVSPRGAVAHTSDGWVYPTLDEARAMLLDIVRAWLPLRGHLPDGRAALAAASDGAWRVWVLAPHVVTLAEAFDEAAATGSASALATAIADACDAIALHSGAAREGVVLGAMIDELAVIDGRLVTLWMPGCEAVGAQSLVASLRERLSPFTLDGRARSELRGWGRLARSDRRGILEDLLRP